MKNMIRPASSWLALIDQLQPLTACEFTVGWLNQMRDKLDEGWALTEFEMARLERLRDELIKP
jgi:hypothetical protein